MKSGVHKDWQVAFVLSPTSRMAAILFDHPSHVAFLHISVCLFGAWRGDGAPSSVAQIERYKTCPAGKGKTWFQTEGAEVQLANTIMGT